MFTKFLRENMVASLILMVIRLYLGYAFLTAGIGKLTKGFDATGYLKGAVAKPVMGADGGMVYGTYVGFLKHFALPNASAFNIVVPVGELLIGIGLILGCLTTAAIFFAMVMNFAFMMAGTVSTNPLDILLGIFIIVAGFNAGRIGLDYWVIPALRRTVSRKEKEHKVHTLGHSA